MSILVLAKLVLLIYQLTVQANLGLVGLAESLALEVAEYRKYQSVDNISW